MPPPPPNPYLLFNGDRCPPPTHIYNSMEIDAPPPPPEFAPQVYHKQGLRFSVLDTDYSIRDIIASL